MDDLPPIIDFHISQERVSAGLKTASRLRLLMLAAASATGLLAYFFL